MTNKSKNIYFPEDGILLDRESAYISIIFSHKKEIRTLDKEREKVTFFGKKVKYTMPTESLNTK